MILVIYALLIFNITFAEVADFSVHDSQGNFLRADFSEPVRQSLSSDFIFPLVDYERQELEKIVLRADKKTWQYVIKKGESLWSISRKFNIPIKEILAFNNLKDGSYLKAGDKIVLPGVEPKAKFSVVSVKFVGKFVSALKEVDDLVVPVSGFNWGKTHGLNGTDIAAPCGNEVFAANSGIVIEANYGWNGGYGNYITIRHNDGSYTLYGHLQMLVVKIGDIVEKGELIGYVGNTGYTVGPTGCHLHFEVRGRTNPLLR